MDIILYIILCMCLVGLEENCQGVGLHVRDTCVPTVDRSFSDWAIVGGSESMMMYGCECTVTHTLYIQLVSSCVSFPIRAHCWNRPRSTGKPQTFLRILLPQRPRSSVSICLSLTPSLVPAERGSFSRRWTEKSTRWAQSHVRPLTPNTCY